MRTNIQMHKYPRTALAEEATVDKGRSKYFVFLSKMWEARERNFSLFCQWCLHVYNNSIANKRRGGQSFSNERTARLFLLQFKTCSSSSVVYASRPLCSVSKETEKAGDALHAHAESRNENQ